MSHGLRRRASTGFRTEPLEQRALLSVSPLEMHLLAPEEQLIYRGSATEAISGAISKSYQVFLHQDQWLSLKAGTPGGTTSITLRDPAGQAVALTDYDTAADHVVYAPARAGLTGNWVVEVSAEATSSTLSLEAVINAAASNQGSNESLFQDTSIFGFAEPWPADNEQLPRFAWVGTKSANTSTDQVDDYTFTPGVDDFTVNLLSLAAGSADTPNVTLEVFAGSTSQAGPVTATASDVGLVNTSLAGLSLSFTATTGTAYTIRVTTAAGTPSTTYTLTADIATDTAAHNKLLAQLLTQTGPTLVDTNSTTATGTALERAAFERVWQSLSPRETIAALVHYGMINSAYSFQGNPTTVAGQVQALIDDLAARAGSVAETSPFDTAGKVYERDYLNHLRPNGVLTLLSSTQVLDDVDSGPGVVWQGTGRLLRPTGSPGDSLSLPTDEKALNQLRSAFTTDPNSFLGATPLAHRTELFDASAQTLATFTPTEYSAWLGQNVGLPGITSDAAGHLLVGGPGTATTNVTLSASLRAFPFGSSTDLIGLPAASYDLNDAAVTTIYDGGYWNAKAIIQGTAATTRLPGQTFTIHDASLVEFAPSEPTVGAVYFITFAGFDPATYTVTSATDTKETVASALIAALDGKTPSGITWQVYVNNNSVRLRGHVSVPLTALPAHSSTLSLQNSLTFQPLSYTLATPSLDAVYSLTFGTETISYTVRQSDLDNVAPKSSVINQLLSLLNASSVTELTGVTWRQEGAGATAKLLGGYVLDAGAAVPQPSETLTLTTPNSVNNLIAVLSDSLNLLTESESTLGRLAWGAVTDKLTAVASLESIDALDRPVPSSLSVFQTGTGFSLSVDAADDEVFLNHMIDNDGGRFLVWADKWALKTYDRYLDLFDDVYDSEKTFSTYFVDVEARLGLDFYYLRGRTAQDPGYWNAVVSDPRFTGPSDYESKSLKAQLMEAGIPAESLTASEIAGWDTSGIEAGIWNAVMQNRIHNYLNRTIVEALSTSIASHFLPNQYPIVRVYNYASSLHSSAIPSGGNPNHLYGGAYSLGNMLGATQAELSLAPMMLLGNSPQYGGAGPKVVGVEDGRYYAPIPGLDRFVVGSIVAPMGADPSLLLYDNTNTATPGRKVVIEGVRVGDQFTLDALATSQSQYLGTWKVTELIFDPSGGPGIVGFKFTRPNGTIPSDFSGATTGLDDVRLKFEWRHFNSFYANMRALRALSSAYAGELENGLAHEYWPDWVNDTGGDEEIPISSTIGQDPYQYFSDTFYHNVLAGVSRFQWWVDDEFRKDASNPNNVRSPLNASALAALDSALTLADIDEDVKAVLSDPGRMPVSFDARSADDGYVLSGADAGGARVWRLTVDPLAFPIRSSSTSNGNLIISLQTSTGLTKALHFVSGRVAGQPDNTGLWIIQDTAPVDATNQQTVASFIDRGTWFVRGSDSQSAGDQFVLDENGAGQPIINTTSSAQPSIAPPPGTFNGVQVMLGIGPDDFRVASRPAAVTSLTVFGDADDDNLTGSAGDDALFGGVGGDGLSGMAGDDSLVGGPESDALSGGEGDDTLAGGDGDDFYLYTASADALNPTTGGTITDFGSDVLVEGSDASAGNDSLFFVPTGLGVEVEPYPYAVILDLSNDALQTVSDNGATIDPQPRLQIDFDGAQNFDNVVGGDFDDQIFGNDAANGIVGAGGNDALFGGDNGDALFGDGIIAAMPGDFEILVENPGNDLLFGQSGDDSLFGGPLGDLLEGALGDDLLLGDDGDDTLIGGEGDDGLTGGAGDDTYGYHGSRALFEPEVLATNLGHDTLSEDAAGGDDMLLFVPSELIDDPAFAPYPYDVTLDLSLVEQDASTVSGNAYLTITLANPENFEGAIGGDGSDTLTGNSGHNTLVGASGGDALLGGEGDDVLLGDSYGVGNLAFTVTAAGNDTLRGGDGDDVLDGDAGDDDLFGDAGNDSIAAGAGADALFGGEGDDTLAGGGDDDIYAYMASPDFHNPGVGTDIADYGSDMLVEAADEGSDTIIFLPTGLDATGLHPYQYPVTLDLSDDDLQTISDDGATTDPQPTLRIDFDGAANFENVVGGDFDDQIIGNAVDNGLFGAGGNDALIGGDGNDILIGDGLAAEEPGGFEIVVETPGNNQLLGQDGDDTLRGGDGEDDLAGGAGNDEAYGQGGQDALLGGEGDDRLDGGADNDLYAYLASSDFLNPGTGTDISDYGLDTLVEEADGGSDIILFLPSNAEPSGLVPYQYSLALDLSDDDLQTVSDDGATTDPQPTLRIDFEGAENFEGVIGGDHDDRLIGNSADNLLVGAGGDDRLQGAGGNDALYGDSFVSDELTVLVTTPGMNYLAGGDGNDLLIGGGGTDLLAGDGIDLEDVPDFVVVSNNPGTDLVAGYAGDDYLFGGDGGDLLFGDGTLEAPATSDGNDLILGEGGDDGILGGGGDDSIYGQAGDDEIYGMAGNDLLNGDDGEEESPDYVDGNDSISGGFGDDTILGGGGRDELSGDDGDDILSGGTDDQSYTLYQDLLLGGDGDDTLVGDTGGSVTAGGNDYLVGGPGNDTLSAGAGDDVAYGDDATEAATDGNDLFSGGNGNDLLYGAGGNDLIGGQYGDDTLTGGSGNDVLWAEWGDDVLYGGNGSDLLSGGDGEDVLHGGAGDDILLSGNAAWTYEQQNLDAASAILVVWSNSSYSYEDRIDFILGNTTPPAPLTEDLLLVPGDTAFEGELNLGELNTNPGDEVDDLHGDTGRDWFFAQFADSIDTSDAVLTSNDPDEIEVTTEIGERPGF